MGTQSRLGDLLDLGTVMRWSLVLGAFAIVFAAVPSPLAQIGVGLLIFLAAFAAGAILGFIFSVPKAVDPTTIVAPAAVDPGTTTGSEEAVPAPAPSTTGRGRLLNTNTALERISEWLATMLVGVGLSQLYNVNNLLIDFRDSLKVHGPPGSLLPAIGPLILIIGVIAGFMFLYVYTRLILPAAFYKAEQINSGQVVLDPVAGQVLKDFSRFLASTDSVASSAELVNGGPDIVSPAEIFALRSVANTPRPTAENATSLMRSLLYKPGGYAQVIDLAANLTSSAAANRADFWFYLAAAFGQLHAATPPEAKAARAQAREQLLNAVRRCIAIDPRRKADLLRLTDPGATDNYLATLKEDPGLLDLLRQ